MVQLIHPDLCIIAFGQLGNEAVGVGCLGSCHNFIHRGAGTAVGNVIKDAAGEQPKLPSQPVQVHVTHIHAVYQHLQQEANNRVMALGLLAQPATACVQ